MLCGKPPFEAEGVVQTYERVKAGTYYIPTHISAEAATLIQHMLMHDRTLRPSMQGVLCSPFCQDALIVWPLTNAHLRRPPHEHEYRQCVSSVHQMLPPQLHRSMPNVHAAAMLAAGTAHYYAAPQFMSINRKRSDLNVLCMHA
jgi:serine/threonine protein kinase